MVACFGAAGKVAAKFYQSDVAPALAKVGKDGKEIGKIVAHVLAPRAFASRDALNLMMEMKGEKEYSLTHIEAAFRSMEKFFDQAKKDAQIDFVDRIQTGQRQATPELQQMADALTSTLEGQRASEIEAANLGRRPGEEKKLPTKANYFPNKWKTPPGTNTVLDEFDRISAIGRARGPLQGSKGYNKHQSYTLKSGVQQNGVPADYNPVRVMQTRVADGLKFVTAQRMWYGLKQFGMRKYVQKGDKAPDGWVQINDRIAKAYYPATVLDVDLDSFPGKRIHKEDLDTHTTFLESGEWYVEPSAARLLNNYLSADWFKNNAIGKGIMAFKMASTGIELAVSPFHLFNMGVEAVGSQIGLGLMHAVNGGIGKGSPTAFLGGLKELLTAPAAPVTIARTGGSAIQAMGDFGKFLTSDRGKEFLKTFPDAPRMIRLLFHGGITTGMPREFRTGLWDSMKEAAKDDNYFGAFVRSVPALAEQMMKPLFESYIPRLKMGYAMQALSQRLAEEHERILSGDITEAEIARQVVDATENNFGEMNFSNLFWHNTFKGAMQLNFRSVTWKLTNWRGLAEGMKGQTQAFADPLKAWREDQKEGRKGSDRTAKPPRVDLNMGRLIGIAITTALLSTIATKYMTGKWPWEYLDEDRDAGMRTGGALALEMTHARTGAVDSYTGKPVRWTLPSGIHDYEHAAEDPRGYLSSSLSGFISKGFDTWNNRDFFGNYVYDPNGSELSKLRNIFSYNMPLPISVQNVVEGHKTGDYTRAKLGAVGISKASTRLDMTPLEKHLEGIRRAQHVPHTPDDQQLYQEKRNAIRSGDISGKEARREEREAEKPYLIRLFEHLNYWEARNAYNNFANDQEKEVLRHALAKKRQSALKSSPQSTLRREHALTE